MLPAHPNEPDVPEAPRRRFRKLRIAWSVFWGVLAVLLCVQWVRSYWWVDAIGVDPTRQIVSYRGILFVDGGVYYDAEWEGAPTLRRLGRIDFLWASDPPVSLRNFSFSTGPRTLTIPQWLPVLVAGLIAYSPWIRRFSLRTLLIATTLAAVLLGLAVWAAS